MIPFFQQIYAFLSTSPGNFIYHAVLVLCIVAVLLAAIQSNRLPIFPHNRRVIIGLSILLACQVLLFCVGFLTWMGWLGEMRMLPALDRMVSFLSLIWLAWLWVFPEPVKLADITAFLLSVVGLVYFMICVIFTAKLPQGGFNLSGWETGWQTGSLLIVIFGLLFLLLCRPMGWGNALAVFLLAFLGHLVSLVWRGEGDFPGFLRFFHLALFPLLFTLLQYQPTGSKQVSQKKLVSELDENVPVWEEKRLYTSDAATFQTLLRLAGDSSIKEICPNLVRGVAETMLADMSSMIVMGGDDNLAFPCTYDLVHETFLAGMNLEKESIPRLSTAFLESHPLRISALDNSVDMDALCQAFSLENAGSLLYVPIPATNQNPIGGILLLSPYSAREWTEADQEYLEKASVYLERLVERGDKYSALTSERDGARSELNTTQAELMELKSRLDQEEFFPGEQADRRMMSSSIQADKLASMTAMHAEAQKKIEHLYTDLDQLRLENEQLRLVGVPLPAAPEQVEAELPQSRDQVTNLENSLVETQQRLKELEAVSGTSSDGEKLGELSSIARDLEEPMTSIVDYTDLLLGESIGTLGPLQKKYVDKVRASTEILGSLVNDLVQVTRMDTGRIEIKPELVELNMVVDNAMGFVGTSLREKNLTLRLDIPEAPSHIIIDGEVLQQILIQLMKNATSASPVEGVVTLRMQVREQDGKSQLLLLVTDTGEGIASEQIPLAFNRRYATDQAHIPGVGDTGVGLAIVKKLVEIQGGQIWVDSQEKNGSTFNVVLPMELSGAEH